ncbi:TRAP transporter large permease subunit [Halomonas sp. PA16-9]|nr:TRAP transporter large permease subunit [Halomonas sp. PA16-9]
MILLLVSLMVLLLIGVPIAYSLGLSGLVYFLIMQPGLIGVLPQRVLSGMDLYTMIALPLFILMGLVMNASGITARLIDFCLMLVGRFPGGLGHVNISTSMIFGGISGSSVSDTASVGSAMIPEMARKGYSVESQRYYRGIFHHGHDHSSQCAHGDLRCYRAAVYRHHVYGEPCARFTHWPADDGHHCANGRSSRLPPCPRRIKPATAPPGDSACGTRAINSSVCSGCGGRRCRYSH